MPEGEKVVLVLQPVGEVDDPCAQQLAEQAAQRTVYVPLARHREPLRGQAGQGHVTPGSQPLNMKCWLIIPIFTGLILADLFYTCRL